MYAVIETGGHQMKVKKKQADVITLSRSARSATS